MLLLRHGTTEWSASHRLASRTDVSLSSAGRKEAAAVGRELAGVNLARVFSSPMSRARETAECIVGLADGPEVELVAGIAEQDFGDFEGMYAEEVAGLAPDWWRVGHSVDPASVEPGADVVARARGALEQGWEGVALAVGHGVCWRLLLCELLDMPLGSFRKLKLDTCGAAIVTIHGAGVSRVVAVNVPSLRLFVDRLSVA